MDDDQTRSSDQRDGATIETAEGVGGRQTETPTPLGGGGYQDIRTVLNFRASDMRIDDLKKMGLPLRHLRIAEAIGVDSYILLWRLVGSGHDFVNRNGYIEFRMRPFRSFLRYQRDLYIKVLQADGLRAPEIKKRLKGDLGESISKRRILWVMQNK